jgi:cysteine synthase
MLVASDWSMYESPEYLWLTVLQLSISMQILGKAEWLNPGGSVKDRAALYLVNNAEKSGQIKPGGTVVEGTAGNTGIGLAHVCNAKGYKLIIYMPNTQSQEKVDILRLLGATVRLVPAVPITDPNHFTFQARDCAQSMENAVWTNQFDNVANRLAHFEMTGPEIWQQTGGQLDAFVCATGTGGTLAGTAMSLKQLSGNKVKIFLADPFGSVLYTYITTKGAKMERVGSSITEGIGQGRVTDNLRDALPLIDDAVQIDDKRVIDAVFRLLSDEGIFIGASSALNVVAAEEVARKLGPGHTIVTMICDGAGRYVSRLFSKKWLESKGLYDSVPEDCKKFVSLP